MFLLNKLLKIIIDDEIAVYESRQYLCASERDRIQSLCRFVIVISFCLHSVFCVFKLFRSNASNRIESNNAINLCEGAWAGLDAYEKGDTYTFNPNAARLEVC